MSLGLNCPENTYGPSKGTSRVSWAGCRSEKPSADKVRSRRRRVVYREFLVDCFPMSSDMDSSSELRSILSSRVTRRSYACTARFVSAESSERGHVCPTSVLVVELFAPPGIPWATCSPRARTSGDNFSGAKYLSVSPG